MKGTVVLWEENVLQGDYLAQIYQPAGLSVIRVTTYQTLRQHLSPTLPMVTVLNLAQISSAQLGRLRRQFPLTSILVLSAQQEMNCMLDSLAMGADDYLIKPFHPQELLVRSQVLLRRTQAAIDAVLALQTSQHLQFGAWTLHPQRYEVERAGLSWQLNRREFKLFHYFCTHPRQLISRQHLLQLLWPDASPSRSRQLDNLILSLRKKLMAAHLRIETRYGEGYIVTLDI